jgi:hypothetical protein
MAMTKAKADSLSSSRIQAQKGIAGVIGFTNPIGKAGDDVVDVSCRNGSGYRTAQ